MSFDTNFAFGTRLARHDWHMLLDRWERLQPHADRFATAFFDTLFAREPDLRHVFGGASLEAQFLRFAHLLSEIVSAEGDLDELDRRVELIVYRFANDDTATRQSRAVKAAIAAMLEEVAAAHMTPEMRASWKAVYAMVATMLGGATWQVYRRNVTVLLNTAMRAELAADRRSASVEQLLEHAPDAEAA
jgi:hemoglobin-like flavoprotein